jgi:ribosome maturation factor RimP
VEPTVAALGFDLVAVEWVAARTLRLSIDRAEGVSIDDCGRLSEVVSPLIDADDPIQGSWRLEVSSPGIDRPVQRDQDFHRFTGRRVRVRVLDGPRRRATGTLLGLEGDDVVVDVDGQHLHFPRAGVAGVHLVLTLDEYLQLAEDRHDQ